MAALEAAPREGGDEGYPDEGGDGLGSIRPGLLRAGMAMEREAERKKQEQRNKVAEAQKQDAKLAETRRRHMDDAFKNEITPDFFAQFGTSAR